MAVPTPLPPNWRPVTASDLEFATCASLLANAHPESSNVTTSNLSARLSDTYYEPLAQPSPTTQPLLRLYGYKPPSTSPATTNPTNLVVAFHKSIDRTIPTVPTGSKPGQSSPQRRWWLITVGVAQPVTGTSYGLVNTLCTWFYKQMAPYEALYTVDDYGRLQNPHRYNPNKYEVDNASAQLSADTTIQPTNQSIVPAASPFSGVLGSATPLIFTQLTPAP